MKDGAVTLTGKKGPAYQGGSKASYTPNSSINELSYGKDGGKAAALGNVPSVVVGGASEVAPLPAMPGGNFTIGENKNVSEIVGY